MKELLNDKIDALKEEYSIKLTELNDKFSDVKFEIPSMKIKLDTNFSGINIAVIEDKFRWSQEVVKVTATKNWNSDELTFSMNHGSGGWNNDVSVEDSLKVNAEAFSGALKLVELMKNEPLYFVKTIKELTDTLNKIYDFNKEKLNIEANETKIKLSKDIAPLLNTLARVEKLEDLFDNTNTSYYTERRLMEITVTDKISVTTRNFFERTTDKKTTYRLNGGAIRKQALIDLLKNGNYFVLPNWALENTFKGFSTNFNSVEELQKYIK